MANEPLVLDRVETRSDARCLQTFTCALDHPRSEGGRKLPHPRPWEWEAQSLLRNLALRLRPSEVALVARSSHTCPVLGAIWLQFPSASDHGQSVFLAAAGVTLSMRGAGGHVADQLVAGAIAIGMERAKAAGHSQLVATGKIHLQNLASQRMVERAGFEPLGVSGDYQLWGLIVPVE